MDEQIFREGEWSGDLDEKALLRVYLVHPSGEYHHDIFVQSRHDALRMIAEYGVQVPRAFVTYQDEVIFDMVDGMLEFPEDAAPLLAAYKDRFPEWEGPFDGTVVVTEWISATCRELKALTLDHALDSGFTGLLPLDYEHPVNRLDRELLSVAAGGDFNLRRFGYSDPGIVVANLERFDRPQPATQAAPRPAHAKPAPRRGLIARLFGRR